MHSQTGTRHAPDAGPRLVTLSLERWHAASASSLQHDKTKSSWDDEKVDALKRMLNLNLRFLAGCVAGMSCKC